MKINKSFLQIKSKIKLENQNISLNQNENSIQEMHNFIETDNSIGFKQDDIIPKSNENGILSNNGNKIYRFIQNM